MGEGEWGRLRRIGPKADTAQILAQGSLGLIFFGIVWVVKNITTNKKKIGPKRTLGPNLGPNGPLGMYLIRMVNPPPRGRGFTILEIRDGRGQQAGLPSWLKHRYDR